ncbi:MAG: hypothetical protein IPH12_07255 [Saprospirales bacterium]|nr:hypothetical protein [Saprospirales bacterium]
MMDIDDILFDKIERFLRGKMPAGEVQAFEAEIAANPALAEQVAMHQMEMDSLELALEDDLRERFGHWKNEPPGTAERPGMRPGWPLLLVVAALLSVAGIWWFWLKPAPESPRTAPAQPERQAPVSTPDRPVASGDRPAAAPEPADTRATAYLALAETAHQLPARMNGLLRSGTTAAETPADPLAAGIKAYGAGDWNRAVAGFQQISPQDSLGRYGLAQEWLGHAYFKRRDFEKAAGIFQGSPPKVPARQSKTRPNGIGSFACYHNMPATSNRSTRCCAR